MMLSKNQLAEKLKTFEEVVLKHYPAWWPVIAASLSVVSCLCFKDMTQPITLIFVGGSSSGKTSACWTVYPQLETLQKHFYRSDNFTPRSFVSHSSSKKKKELEKDDMLPQLENKVLFTKDLAPIFRGDDDELVDTFKILTPILDGKGYISNSGAHGRRGYDKNCCFHWIGCTTPLTYQAHMAMANCGTRMIFYNVPQQDIDDEELANFVRDYSHETKQKECKSAAEDFLSCLFNTYPPRTLTREIIDIGIDESRQIARLAKFLGKLRADFSAYHNKSGELEHKTPTVEGPHRVAEILRDLLIGHALIHGNNSLSNRELELAKKIVLSTAPEDRRMAMELVLKKGGICTANDFKKEFSVSINTANHKLEELHILKICEIGTQAGKAQRPNSQRLFRLCDEYHSLFNLSNVPQIEPILLSSGQYEDWETSFV